MQTQPQLKYARKAQYGFLTLLLVATCVVIPSAWAKSPSRTEILKGKLTDEVSKVEQALSGKSTANEEKALLWQAQLKAIKSSLADAIYDSYNLEPEIHVVVKTHLGWHVPSSQVKLSYKGGPIILALGGSTADWKLEQAPGVSLRKIVLLGRSTASKGLPASIPVVRVDDFYVGEVTPFDENIAEKLKSVTGYDTATILRDFWHTAVGPENMDWRAEYALYRLRCLHKEITSSP